MQNLTVVGIDFESYYDVKYSLTHLTTIEYVLDPQFEAIGVSLSIDGAPAVWKSGTFEEIKKFLGQVDWENALCVAHNAQFDGAILEWIFGYHPAAYFCTMMASRPFVAPHTGKMSLASVASFLGAGVKGNEVQNHRGKRRTDFTAYDLHSYGNYCCNDTNLTVKCAAILRSYLPDDEQYLLDLTIKKFTRPKFQLDADAISEGLGVVMAQRNMMEEALKKIKVTIEDVRSRPKLAAKLRALGVVPPSKISKTTGLATEAFAKDDDEFVMLRTHPNPRVQLLVEGRLMFASSIEQSRFERFQKIYDLNLGGRHLLPVPLLYYAAHPGRFGGNDSLNMQNMPRPNKKVRRKGALRRCVIAPPGFSVVAADFSNIEARMVATLAGQTDLIQAFANKEDIYSKFASRIYGRHIDKDKDPIERFVGKTCILGLGYGMGWKKFQHQMLLNKVPMTEVAARNIVNLYRETYRRIPQLWSDLGILMGGCTDPKYMRAFGPITFAHERIVLPNGMPIIYPGLKFDTVGGGMTFTSKRKKAEGFDNHLWGGVVTENISQALSRIVATRAEIRLARAGLPCTHQAHDELIWVIPTHLVARLVPLIEQAMVDPVPWLPNLPIAVEINHGQTYGDAK